MKLCIFLLFFCTNCLFGSDYSSNSEVFTYIYDSAEWGRDAYGKGSSGDGSNPEYAQEYIEFLQNFLRHHNIKTVVDLGCGDWQIGRVIDWSGVHYLGIDVVSSVIRKNVRRFSSSNVSFIKADGIDYDLPQADLLLCKEVLQHLPHEDIQKIAQQFPKFKYCILVNDVDPVTLTSDNEDIVRGSLRCLDLTKPPFNLRGEKIFHYVSKWNTKQVVLIEN